MSGTRAGSLKAVAIIKEKYGEAFYKNIGSTGGKSIKSINPMNGKALKGFALSGKASEAGKIGGMNSKRGKANAKMA